MSAIARRHDAVWLNSSATGNILPQMRHLVKWTSYLVCPVLERLGKRARCPPSGRLSNQRRVKPQIGCQLARGCPPRAFQEPIL